jgi:anti-sigma B factor antagonist
VKLFHDSHQSHLLVKVVLKAVLKESMDPDGVYGSASAAAAAAERLLAGVVLTEISPGAERLLRSACHGARVLKVHQEVTPEGYAVCRPVGELESFTVSQFREALAAVASPGCLLIDLSGVAFIDSAGLGALIGGIRHTRELGGRVAVACSRPTLVRLLRTTGFDRVVTVADTLANAAAALAAEGGDVVANGDRVGVHLDRAV